MLEGLKDPKDNPCWKGYKPVGTKKKNGKTVPNCVPKESIEEARDDVEAAMSKIAASGDDGYDMIYNGLNGQMGGEVEAALQDMYSDISREHRLHPDDDFEEILDVMVNRIDDDYGSVDEMQQGAGKITDIKPGQTATIQTAPGVSTTIDLKQNPTALAKDETGKLKLVTAPQQPGQGPEQGSEIKPGDEVQLSQEDSKSTISGDEDHDEITKLLVQRLRKLSGVGRMTD